MKFRNIEHVRDELGEVFFSLKQGDIKTGIAQELNNGAGKLINAVKLELEYYALRREAPNIPFLFYNGSTANALPVNVVSPKKLAKPSKK